MQNEADTLDVLVWISYHTAVPAWLLPYGHRINGVCQVPDNYDDEMVREVASQFFGLKILGRRNT